MNAFQEKSFRDKWSPEALAAIGRLDFIAREILDGVQQGLHRSIRRGFSSEFFDYKNYQPGDDASRIDWRLFAKTGKYYIKRFEAETSLECMILADFSPSMRWRWKDTVSKSDYAACLLAALALLFTRQRDLVGLHSFGTHPERHIPPRASSKQAELLISMMLPSGSPLRAATARGGANAAAGEVRRSEKGKVSSLLQTARGISSILQHRGLILLASDFEMPEEEIQESFSRLKGKGNELVVFHLLDIAEITLPFEEATHFRDSETGQLMPVRIKTLRETMRQRVESFRAAVKSAAEAVNADYIPADTAMSPVDVILRMNQVRKEHF